MLDTKRQIFQKMESTFHEARELHFECGDVGSGKMPAIVLVFENPEVAIKEFDYLAEVQKHSRFCLQVKVYENDLKVKLIDQVEIMMCIYDLKYNRDSLREYYRINGTRAHYQFALGIRNKQGTVEIIETSPGGKPIILKKLIVTNRVAAFTELPE